jgi:pentatricopeptide repeat protein
MRAARVVFDEFPHRDALSLNSLISAYSRGGWYVECLELFHEFVQARAGDGVQPNCVAVSTALHACDQLNAFDFRVYVLRIADEIGLDMEVAAWNSVVVLYAE